MMATTYQAGEVLLERSEDGTLRKGTYEREISRWVTRRRVSALVDNVLEDTRWTAYSQKNRRFFAA